MLREFLVYQITIIFVSVILQADINTEKFKTIMYKTASKISRVRSVPNSFLHLGYIYMNITCKVFITNICFQTLD